MALLIDFAFRGLSVPQAYVRVVSPTISVDKASIDFGVQYRVSPEAELLDAATYSSPYELQGENPIRQAYAYLKTLPEFADAVDVLEEGQAEE